MSASASAATGDRAGSPAVAWVESPLQLINAIEFGAIEFAASGFAASEGIALLIEPRDDVVQLDDTIAAIRSTLPPGVDIAEPVSAADRGAFRGARHQVVGDVFSGQFRLLVARWGIRELTIVDDGSATVHFAASLAGAPFVRMAQVESRAMQILGALVKRRILKAARGGRVSLFTAYGDDESVRALAAAGIRIVPNTYGWLRSLSTLGAAPRHGRVILGSALVTDGQIGIDDYLAWVSGIAGDGDVSYLPHRREDAAQRAAVATVPGVTVEPGVLPAELALGSSGSLERVDTLPSSAVATLRAILPDSVPIVVSAVPASWWLPGADPAIRRAFDQLAQPVPGAVLYPLHDRKDDDNVD